MVPDTREPLGDWHRWDRGWYAVVAAPDFSFLINTHTCPFIEMYITNKLVYYQMSELPSAHAASAWTLELHRCFAVHMSLPIWWSWSLTVAFYGALGCAGACQGFRWVQRWSEVFSKVGLAQWAEQDWYIDAHGWCMVMWGSGQREEIDLWRIE